MRVLAWERAEGEEVGILASGLGEGRELGQEGRGWAGQRAFGVVLGFFFPISISSLFLSISNSNKV